jgi:flagellar protein FliL
MAQAAAPQDAAKKKRTKRPLIVGLGLALFLAAGGFLATYTGLLFAPSSGHPEEGDAIHPLPDIAFVPIEPVIVSLGPAAQSQHLRFRAELEVQATRAAEVTLLLPRILDVLNGYLRAVEVAELEDPAALVRIRAHLLRRVQIVTGEGRVRDLLVTEFVLN